MTVALTSGESVATRLGMTAPGQRARRHQRQNAAVAVAAAEALRRLGLPLSPSAVERGLAEAWLPARQEIVSERPLILVDAAHNVDSARALAETLSRQSEARPWLVLGMLRDKDASAMLRVLAPCVAGAVVAHADEPARARGVGPAPMPGAPCLACPWSRRRQWRRPSSGLADTPGGTGRGRGGLVRDGSRSADSARSRRRPDLRRPPRLARSDEP